MRTRIRWAEVHAPLFLSDTGGKGINLGQKLCTKQRTGLVLEYDEAKKHLFVSFQGMSVRVPETSVLSMVEFGSDEPKAPAAPTPPVPAVDAQASSPHAHVFAGAGHGQTGQETPKPIAPSPMPNAIAEAMAVAKRGPGRPPKDKG